MKKIIAQLTANNQVLIRYTNRPNCLKSKQQGDLSGDKAQEHIACMQYKVENIDKILTHGCKEYEHESLCYIDADKSKPGTMRVTSMGNKASSVFVVPVKYPACRIDVNYEYFDEEALKLEKSSYRELCRQKAAALDIIKKSQRITKKHSCWGKRQTIKRFTLNAKQRILEAGSVVDKDCGKESSFEVTLTIPGGGYNVFRVVSEWSGWIVNRQTQVIRRHEAKGAKVYWFFVWEHQKRGALHQHWCISIPGKPDEAEALARRIRAKWFELLMELSEKTSIDLFKKKGSFWSWKNTPSAWQTSISQVRKSVAAYFSKYTSKNAQTSRYNEKLRTKSRDYDSRELKNSREQPIYTLCPSRYWGSGSRVKKRCRELRVELCFTVFSKQEGDYIAKTLFQWVAEISTIVGQVHRNFVAASPETDFIYCSGWEQRLWFGEQAYGGVYTLFERIRTNPARKGDAIGAIAELHSM